MAHIWRQIWTLTHKNLIITLYRHWLSTPLRALFFPLLFVIFLYKTTSPEPPGKSYSRNLFFPSSQFGIGEPRPVRTLFHATDGASGGRNRIVFVNSGFSGGEIDLVITNVTAPLRGSNILVKTFQTENELRTECHSSFRGSSRCMCAAVFYASPSEGSGGRWNYSIRADGILGTKVNTKAGDNDAQIYTLPLQHSIDSAISRLGTLKPINGGASKTIFEYPFTARTHEQQQDDIHSKYMNNVVNILAVAFYISMVGVVYQTTGLIATERETGMADLLDTMMPNQTSWQRQMIRLTSYHLAFVIIYGPGWVGMGAILGAMAFRETSVIIPIVFNMLSGLSLTSFAVFAGGFFRKAQLSGILAVIVSFALAILAQLSGKVATWVMAVLSFLFPPMNYVYFIITVARWESQTNAANLLRPAPNISSALPAIVFWIFAILQAVIYPFLGAIVERGLYGIPCTSRKTKISNSPVAVHLSRMSKAYRRSFLRRAISFMTRKHITTVWAVEDLSLQAYRGEIMVLLGANGSGKSTTLDAIAGIHPVSSGEIVIDYPNSQGTLGYCPQKNILWDDLTVAEHVKVFDSIKSVGPRSSADNLRNLIKDCDLAKKDSTYSKHLSGGQKRKLQMAMMFAGRSTVCCVDEVSSGVDPLSRRKLWDILLAERGRRSIILTTHFLDEADLLADRIAILAHGSLKAEGTCVELKQRLGTGYRVHLYNMPGVIKPPLYGDVLHANHEKGTVYYPGTSADTLVFLKRLQEDGLKEYQVSGPTIEDAFLKVADEANSDHASFDHGSDTRSLLAKPAAALVSMEQGRSSTYLELLSGRRTSMLKQFTILFSKRFTILLRNIAPSIAALAIPIVTAGCASIFLRNVESVDCNPALGGAASGLESSAQSFRLIAGPMSQLSEIALQKISEAPPGSVTYVENLSQFDYEVQRQFANLTPGGFFLGEKPVFAWRADLPIVPGIILQNVMNSMLLNTTIITDYKPLDIPFVADIGNLLIFVTLFGLSMAVYPAFLSLYPTAERLRAVRSMHYSNGVRTLPLWLAYLVFDFLITLTIASVTVAIFSSVRLIWYHMEYLFLTFLLYGAASTLFSYVISLFSPSQLAAFAVTAAIQAGMDLVYFVVFIVTLTYVDASQQNSVLSIAYYSLGVTSPVHSFSRALYLSLNVFGATCRGREIAAYPGAMDVFGGPILYLFIQSFILFGILLWKDAGPSLQFWGRTKSGTDVEDRDTIELETTAGFARISTSSDDGLQVLRLRKKFKQHLAVNDITFGVPRGQCFALIGPNGAGKSTCISMIRGDTQPSSRQSQIFIDGVSALKHRALARSRLGVCPQIDPLDPMTVAEHLRFYAEVRGISNPRHNFKAIIKSVGLEECADRIATTLSGGNKRKLSLGIALMGNPSVLLLDEPSSGMDAVSKRKMWRTLSSVTPGRSLVLTTHSMEEADVLASRAGIIAGKMLALGTTDALRQRYGNGYSIHLVHSQAPHTRPVDMKKMEEWIRQQFPEAEMEKGMYYGQVRFGIPTSGYGQGRSLVEIFETLERGKDRLGVPYYSVSRSTLDQVFLSVVGRHHFEEENRG
ncbi:hypothetical protein AJ78_07243 [Emergomyces pasteurianus Ep9510]|uniref:ABC transporter domain-containing protein n=1 Tax=Emergomyces pasteurianus Ep9510 TaxID=1447872 RepID=A0A1J9PW46_9EURO|nr:hypothetical protein AJ78_07243 [Emergomyces pasteurianus Ep9510]